MMRPYFVLLIAIFLSISNYVNALEDRESLECEKLLLKHKARSLAYPHCKKAAEAGQAVGLFYMGAFYNSGVLVDKDTEEANRLFIQAMEKFKQAALKGDNKAKAYLGTFYHAGFGVARDHAAAIKYYSEAALKLEPMALLSLGNMYEFGESVTQDYSKAISLYKDAFKNGGSCAFKQLASLYETGRGVSKDHSEAIKYNQLAADNGCIAALYDIGRLYEYRAGENLTEALKNYQKAAEAGHFLAQLKLGELYEKGSGVHQNFQTALSWYKLAAEQGEAEAEYKIGKSYELGILQKKNSLEAIKWYRKSANREYAEAQYALARLERGPDDFALYIKAATNGHYESQIYLGSSYEYGFSVEKDPIKSFEWYQKAADNTYDRLHKSQAKYKLAEYYENGIGTAKNLEKAVELYRRAAWGDNSEAQMKIADMYLNGVGVERNFTQAVFFFKKAAEQNDPVAYANLARLYYDGKGVIKNHAEAFNLAKKAAELGSEWGQRQLAVYYLYGTGVKADAKLALAWAILAASKNQDFAEIRDQIEKQLSPSDTVVAQQYAQSFQDLASKNIGLRYLAAFDQSRHEKDFILKVASADVSRSTQSQENLSLSVKPSKPAFSANDIAIIIGIEKYRTVPTTEYATADAAKVREFVTALGIPERNIEFLADDRATLSDIRKVIETKLPNMVKANSRVIVYYAGHGAPGTTRGESYLVPYDGDPSFLADTAYPLSRLYDRLSRLKAKEVLVILDSCFSGSGGRSVIAKNIRPLVMVKDTPPPSSNKMIVLTSARGSQITTSLPEVGHGAFTYFFLRALQEGNRDIGEVYAYLKDRVTEEAKRQNVDQTPTISPEPAMLKGRFVFAR